jgi:hypothetical protein
MLTDIVSVLDAPTPGYGLREGRSTTSDTALPSAERGHVSEYLKSLARSKPRWGAVAVTREYTQGMYIPLGENVMHLTMASEENVITDPEPGKLYI